MLVALDWISCVTAASSSKWLVGQRSLICMCIWLAADGTEALMGREMSTRKVNQYAD